MASVWDRFGLWTSLAAVIILSAYAYPNYLFTRPPPVRIAAIPAILSSRVTRMGEPKMLVGVQLPRGSTSFEDHIGERRCFRPNRRGT